VPGRDRALAILAVVALHGTLLCDGVPFPVYFRARISVASPARILANFLPCCNRILSCCAYPLISLTSRILTTSVTAILTRYRGSCRYWVCARFGRVRRAHCVRIAVFKSTGLCVCMRVYVCVCLFMDV
jgi:hypothetical protein